MELGASEILDSEKHCTIASGTMGCANSFELSERVMTSSSKWVEVFRKRWFNRALGEGEIMEIDIGLTVLRLLRQFDSKLLLNII